MAATKADSLDQVREAAVDRLIKANALLLTILLSPGFNNPLWPQYKQALEAYDAAVKYLWRVNGIISDHERGAG